MQNTEDIGLVWCNETEICVGRLWVCQTHRLRTQDVDVLWYARIRCSRSAT